MPNQPPESELTSNLFRLMRMIRQETVCHKLEIDLTSHQLETLIFLNKSTATPMIEIANYLHVTKPTATVHLKRLAELGLVKRTTEKDDRRIVNISLTKKGSKILNEGLKKKKERMNRLLNYLSANDKKNLLKIISNLVKNIEDHYDK